MSERTREIDTPDGPMPVYEARPDDGAGRGAVVVIQEAFGVNVHIEDVARRFAGAGYHAVAPHMFHRTGGGTVEYGDFAKCMPHFDALTDDLILADVDAAAGFLRDAGWANRSTAVVGFCFGGRVSFLAAARRTFGAAVGFYGGGIVTVRFPQFAPLVSECAALKTPWLGLFGDDDPTIPVDDVDRLRLELDAAEVDTEVVLYEGAGHGFFNDIRADHYAKDAAVDAWARTLAWLESHLEQ